MRSVACFVMLAVLMNSMAAISLAQAPPASQTPGKNIYHQGWIDYNKNGRKDVYEDSKAPIDRRVEDLLRQMTLEEKTCQTATLYGFKRVLQDPLPTPEWKNKIWKDGIANIDEHLNGWGTGGQVEYAMDVRKHVWGMNETQKFFVEETRLGIPVDFTNEGLRGLAYPTSTNFPSMWALGSTWNKKLVNSVGSIIAREGRALGYTNIYAPTLDVPRDPRWGRVEDTFGEDPYLVSRMGVAMASGVQKDYVVASTAKHYAVFGNNKGGREGNARTDPQSSPREVENVLLPAFKAVIKEAGILGYNDYNSEPITGSHYWLTQRLRNEFGFKGYVVSDSAAVEYLWNKHKVAADMKDAVRLSINAGLNVKTNFTPPDDFILPLRELVKEGKVTMKTLDDRVRDVLRVKFTTGIFDRPYIANAEETVRIVGNAEHQKVALQAARESIVLLKNDKNALPLGKDVKSVAVIGPNADEKSNHSYRYGTSSIDGVTILQGIKNKLGAGVKVNYAKGSEIADKRWPESEILPEPLTKEEQDDIDKAVDAAKDSDVAIVVLGDQARTVGEFASRSDLDLPGRQLDLLKAVHATGKPVVLVLINGRPMAINWAQKNVGGIIQSAFPSAHGGTAIADALFGDYNPGGKITMTYVKTVGQLPYNFPTKPNAQSEGEKARVPGALYYFGHGLSYTTFVYSNLKISPANPKLNENVTVTFEVKNTGTRAGDEVAQLYTHDVVSSVTTYEKNLRGFERVSLQPGETKTVTLILKPEDLSLYNKDMKFVVEPGVFKVMVGASSEDIKLNGTFESMLK